MKDLMFPPIPGAPITGDYLLRQRANSGAQWIGRLITSEEAERLTEFVKGDAAITAEQTSHDGSGYLLATDAKGRQAMIPQAWWF